MKEYFKKSKGLLYFFTGIGVIVLILSSSFLVKFIINQMAKDELIQSCKDYLAFSELTVPDEFINYSLEKREEFATKLLEQKKSEYDLLFSTNVEKNVREYETTKKLMQKAVTKESMVTDCDYQFSKLLKLDVGLHKATVVFFMKWSYYEINLSNLRADSQDDENSGSTYYKISFTKENGKWKIVNINWNPFVNTFS